MIIKQFQNFINLLFNTQMSVIVSPNIFGQIKGQPFLANTALAGKFSFKVSPKTFKPIYMTAVFVSIFAFLMFYHAVNVSFGSDSSVTFPGVGTNGGTWFYPTTNEWQKCFRFNVFNYFSPNLATPAQYAKNRCFQTSATTFNFKNFLGLSFILPLPAKIRLVNLNYAAKNFRDIFCEQSSYYGQCPDNSQTIYSGFNCYILAANAPDKPAQNFSPLRCLKSQGQLFGSPLIFTSNAFNFSSSDFITFIEITSRTFMPFCHTTNISLLVAKM